MADDLKQLFEWMRQENAAAHEKTRRHFDVSLERFEKRFDTLAEAVALLDQKSDRQTSALEERLERGFGTRRR